MLKTLEQHNTERREAIAERRKPKRNGIACPKCGAELWDTYPQEALMSNPPQKAINCDCGFHGFAVI